MHSPTQDEQLHALLIEDDVLSLQAAAALLLKSGYFLYTATTAKEALQKSREKLFDLIYLDLGLPDASGIEVAIAIRLDNTNPNVKTTIIGLSAYADQTIQMECIKAGMQYLLTKPLDDEKIETAEVIMNNYIHGRKLDLFLTQQSSITPPIIDLLPVLQNVNGNTALVKDMLTQFMAELPQVQLDIQASFQAQNWEQLQHRVHKLHGAAAYCGVPRLRTAAHAFEAELRKNTNDYAEVYVQFMREIDLLRAEYHQKHQELFAAIKTTLDTSPDTLSFSGNLLLVEDEMINQIIIKELLETLGFTVTTASDGLTALRLLQAADASYVAAIMDVGLPDISGIEVTRRLRDSEAPLRDIPILALTGHVSAKYQTECLISGMNGFLSKPATREQLRHALNRLLLSL